MTKTGERARAVACAAAVAVAAFPGSARAELHESVERVADAWRAVGASVVLDRTRFLTDDNDDDRPIFIGLPSLPEGECTTLVLLGARGLGFHVRLPGADDGAGQRVLSVAGALSIERCGEDFPTRFIVASDSGRGAIETVVARSSKPLPSVRTVLPERSAGPPMPMPRPGCAPALCRLPRSAQRSPRCAPSETARRSPPVRCGRRAPTEMEPAKRSSPPDATPSTSLPPIRARRIRAGARSSTSTLKCATRPATGSSRAIAPMRRMRSLPRAWAMQHPRRRRSSRDHLRRLVSSSRTLAWPLPDHLLHDLGWRDARRAHGPCAARPSRVVALPRSP